jgi:hypothetical protein
LVYKKYTKKGGKVYGPYLYHNKRVGDKIVTFYHGKGEEKINYRPFIFAFLGLIVLVVLLYFIFSYQTILLSPSGPNELAGVYSAGETLHGSVYGFAQNSFVPEDTKISMTLTDLKGKTLEVREEDFYKIGGSIFEQVGTEQEISGELQTQTEVQAEKVSEANEEKYSDVLKVTYTFSSTGASVETTNGPKELIQEITGTKTTEVTETTESSRGGGCFQDSDCSSGHCNNGVCVQCITVDDCSYGQVCNNGFCYTPTGCFLAGTKITTKEGMKSIEQIEVGDKVTSFDAISGKLKYAQVLKTFVHDSDNYLIINGKLKVTPNHPIYSGGKWISAGELRGGDVLVTLEGDETVNSVKTVEEKNKVYNLEVDGTHNYFAEGVLVHNKLPGFDEMEMTQKEVAQTEGGSDTGGGTKVPGSTGSSSGGQGSSYIFGSAIAGFISETSEPINFVTYVRRGEFTNIEKRSGYRFEIKSVRDLNDAEEPLSSIKVAEDDKSYVLSLSDEYASKPKKVAQAENVGTAYKVNLEKADLAAPDIPQFNLNIKVIASDGKILSTLEFTVKVESSLEKAIILFPGDSNINAIKAFSSEEKDKEENWVKWKQTFVPAQQKFTNGKAYFDINPPNSAKVTDITVNYVGGSVKSYTLEEAKAAGLVVDSIPVPEKPKTPTKSVAEASVDNSNIPTTEEPTTEEPTTTGTVDGQSSDVVETQSPVAQVSDAKEVSSNSPLTGSIVFSFNPEVTSAVLSYTTPPPTMEQEVLDNRVIASIIGVQGVNFGDTSVIAFASIPDDFNMDAKSLKVFDSSGKAVEILYTEDKNLDGNVDYVEFIGKVGESYIIEIIKAYHLDANRTFISDVYDYVKALDGNWSETIPDGDFVRVVFEKELNSSNDITVYPRIVNGTPIIEVYEKDKNEVIALFDNITSNVYNQVLLTALNGTQDTFDLRVVNGSLEFDHIVDPWRNNSWGNRKEINLSSSVSVALPDFPFYLNLTKEDRMESDFRDLRFYNGSCNITDSVEIPYEIEANDSSKVNIWLKVPYLTGNTTICMYYNNPNAIPGINSSGVWGTLHRIVHHFDNSDGFHINDSTMYGNNGTIRNSVSCNVAGITDGACKFNGISQDIQVSQPNGLDLTNEFTISAWINFSSSPRNSMRILSKASVNSASLITDSSSRDVMFYGNASTKSGSSLTSGDFNNDGVDDLVIGASGARVNRGEAYLFFGPVNNSGVVNITRDANITYYGRGTATEAFGSSLASGDFNNDSIDDLVMGAMGFNTNRGEVYILYGPLISGTFNATATANVTYNMTAGGSFLGTSLTSGDFNNDGTDDLVIGAKGVIPSNAGAVYLVYGPQTLGNYNISDKKNITFNGSAGNNLGSSVASGDFNNDGLDDLVIGAQAAGGINGNGSAYILYGPFTGSGLSINVSLTANVTFNGAYTSDSFGYSLTVGDFNNDGIDDLIIGANTANKTDIGTRVGASYVVYGPINYSSSTFNIKNMANITVYGTDPGDNLGSGTGSGDFNNDGLDDIAIGAMFSNDTTGLSNTGETYIRFGPEQTNSNYELMINRKGRAVASFTNSAMKGTAVQSVQNLSNGGFNFVAATFNGSALKLYINGQESISKSASGLNANAFDLFIGSFGKSSFFNGTIDEVRIENVSRNADWINQTYQMLKQDLAVEGPIETRPSMNISACPITLDKRDGVYKLNQSINSSGTCITIGAENVTVDGNGNRIVYGNQSLATPFYGIYSNKNYTTIKNCTVQTGNATIAASYSRYGIFFTNNYNGKIENVNVNINFNGIYLLSSSNNSLNNITADSNTIGLTIFPGSNNILSYMSINNSRQNAIYIDDDFGPVEDNFLQNVVITNTNASFYDLNVNGGFRNYISDTLIANYSINSGGYSGVTLYFKDTNQGEIKFLSSMAGATGNNLSNDVRIGNNSVYVNSSQTGLNKSANITLYNVPTNFVNPVILRDGVQCPVGVCYNFTSLTDQNVSFNVTGWSSYSIGEADSNLVSGCRVLNSAGMSYSQSANIIATGNAPCININASNITFDGKGFWISNATFANTGIYSQDTLNITIKNVNVSDMFVLFAGGRITFINVNNSRIDNSTIIDNDGYGIVLSQSSNNRLNNIAVSSNSLSGIVLSQSSNNIIAVITSNSNQRSGIRLDSSSNNKFSNGIINGSWQDAIYLVNLPNLNNTFENLTILGTSSSYRDVRFGTDSINNTQFIDMPYIGNYSFAGIGGTIIVRKTGLGEIRFLQPVNGFGTNFTADIMILNNSATVRSDVNVGLNKSANITLYGIGERGLVRPVILRGGIKCPTGICYNFTALNASIVIFSVTGWSNYSIGEDTSPVGDPLYNCGVLNVPNKAYVLQNDVNSSGTCFNITAGNVTLNGNGRTANYSWGGTGYGVLIDNRDNVVVKNLNVLQGSANPDSYGIYLSKSSNGSMENNSIVTLGSNSHGAVLDTSSNFNSITGNHITVLSSGGQGVKLSSSSSNSFISNTINSADDSINIAGNSQSNLFTLNTIVSNGQTQLNIVDDGIDGTYFKDQGIGSYRIAPGFGVGARIIIEDTHYGIIRFIDSVKGVGPSLISSQDNAARQTAVIRIGENYVYVASSQAGFNKSANITLYKIGEKGFTKPSIMRDDIYVCNRTTSPSCYNFTSLTNLTVVFNVSSWSNYKIGEGNIILLSSCRDLNETNGVYVLERDVAANGTCFNITANNVTLYGNGKTANYSKTTLGYGLYNQKYGNVVVKNVYFVQINSSISDSYGIYYIQGPEGVIEDNTIITQSSRSYGVYLDSSSSLNVLGNTIKTTASSASGLRLSNSDSNTFTSNTINASNAESILLEGTNSQNNVFVSNTIQNSYQTQLSILTAGINGTYLQDQDILNYSIAGSGGTMIVEDTPYGRIEFLQAVNGSGNNLIGNSSSVIRLTNDLAFIDSSQPGFNKSANVILYNVGDRQFTKPSIMRDDIYVCNSTTFPSCYNFTSLTNLTVVFNVSSWSSYGVGEGNVELISSCMDLTESRKVYVLVANVSSLGTCFNVTADNVVLNGNGYWVNYSKSTFGYAVNNSGHANFVLKNANIVQGSISSDSYGVYYFQGSQGSIQNNRITTQGSNGYGVYLDSSSSLNVSGNTIKTTASSASGLRLSNSDSNTFTSNTINASNAESILLEGTNSQNNVFVSNTIMNKVNMQLNISTAGINGTYLKNQNILNYSIAGSGGTVIIENSVYGKIEFLNAVNGSGNNLIGNTSSMIVFFDNYVYVNSSQPGFNKSANVTLYNVNDRGYPSPRILLNGFRICNETSLPSCSNFSSLKAQNVLFNVSSWSSYNIGPEVINLTSCAALNKPYTIYSLQNDVSSNGTCFNITAPGVILEGYGRLVNYSRTAVGYAINNSGYNDTIVRRLNIVQGGTSSNSYAIYYLGGSNALIENNSIKTRGSNSHGIYFDSSSNFNSIGRNNITASGSGGQGIKLSSSSNNNFTSNVINTTVGDAVNLEGNSHFNIFTSNSITNNGQMQLNISTASINGTYLRDQSILNYIVFGAGGTMTIENTSYGKIEFLQPVNGSGVNLMNDVKIGNNSAYVNSLRTGLNKSANITLYNLGERGFTKISILRDAVVCNSTTSPACYNFTALNDLNVRFMVTSWSEYKIGSGDLPIVTLVSPPNGNLTIDRMQTFNWTANGDDGTWHYELNLTLTPNGTGTPCTDSVPQVYSVVHSRNLTLSQPLSCFYGSAEQNYYKWAVRGSRDGINFGLWSDTWVFNLTSYIDIKLDNANMSFGSMVVFTSDNTTDNSPKPFVLTNQGNVKINLTINASSIWSTAPNPNESYEFKADKNGTSGNWSFDRGNSVIGFTPMPNAANPLLAISALNWTGENMCEIDILLKVPSMSEPPGDKKSTVTLIASLGE